MKTSRACFPKTATVLTLWLIVVCFAARAQTFTTLYNFTGGSDGGYVVAGVIRDPAGNLYGTTNSGGSDHYWGTVFKIDTAGTEIVLHNFSGSDGASSYTPVARDKAGNLYGTTAFGGTDDNGTVFKIDTAGKETVLHSFSSGSDGCEPYQGLLRDKAGNLYGTTTSCGASNGTIFKVDRTGTFTLLHTFAGSDGAFPVGGHLEMDESGNLYGLTEFGGAYAYGVAYKLSKKGKLTLLHSFGSGSDGCRPFGSAVQDKAGNLYGTTYYCGANGNGTIWEVSKKGTETILHSFAGGTSDGCNPWAGVTRGSKGNLYGVAEYCGANNDGALYELSAQGRLTLLHSFDYTDGQTPSGEVWRTTKGTLFGTASLGGTYNNGTVWKYVP